MNPSLTIIGIVVAVIGRLGQTYGIHTESVTVENIVILLSTTAQIFGVAVAYLGRLRQGDITWYGIKK